MTRMRRISADQTNVRSAQIRFIRVIRVLLRDSPSSLGLELPLLPSPFAAVYRVGEIIPVGDDMGSFLALWRRPLQVGQPLPVLPLPLNVHYAVVIDLEETYRRAAKRAYLD
jgi:hypothetical protein